MLTQFAQAVAEAAALSPLEVIAVEVTDAQPGTDAYACLTWEDPE